MTTPLSLRTAIISAVENFCRHTGEPRDTEPYCPECEQIINEVEAAVLKQLADVEDAPASPPPATADTNRLVELHMATTRLKVQGEHLETLQATLARSRDTVSLLRGRLSDLVVKLEAMEQPLNAVIGLQFARTGHGYAGPNWGKELSAAKEALALPSSAAASPRAQE